MDHNCIFCKIAGGAIPCDKIYEDNASLAFLDLRPVSKGHALVIPKAHSADFLSSNDEVLAELMPKVKKIGQALMKAVNAQGINITSNNGPAAGQVVFHLHFHLIPRFNSDGLVQWPHHDSEPKTRAELANLIKKYY